MRRKPETTGWLIGLDWGTSSLRAMLFDGEGNVHETRHRPWGVRHLPEGGFEAALASIGAGWPSCPVLAAGMVGSRQGWREAPYVDAPADAYALADRLVTVETADGRCIHIVPGVRDSAAPDVMRGEETQLVGALDLQPRLAEGTPLVLPGTHSKWVRLQRRRIAGFTTLMTGELYGLLRHHSVLGASLPDVSATAPGGSFDEGVRAARASGAAGVLTRLFSARTLMLEGALDAAAVPDYLSGLLIGEEWRAALAAGWLDSGRTPVLIGDEALCLRYRRAAALFYLPDPAWVADAAARGLWRIAHVAGLAGDCTQLASMEFPG
ncbi:MAG: 2-dehydro-3-deoxygalactonokinase [Rhodanobacter sp.]